MPTHPRRRSSAQPPGEGEEWDREEGREGAIANGGGITFANGDDNGSGKGGEEEEQEGRPRWWGVELPIGIGIQCRPHGKKQLSQIAIPCCIGIMASRRAQHAWVAGPSVVRAEVEIGASSGLSEVRAIRFIFFVENRFNWLWWKNVNDLRTPSCKPTCKDNESFDLCDLHFLFLYTRRPFN